MKLREAKFKLQCPVYDWAHIALWLTTDVDETCDNLDRAGCCAARTWRIGSQVFIVLPFSASAGTIAHESVHAALDILDRSGVRLINLDEETGASTFLNDEPLAYLVDTLVAWCVDCLLTQNKKYQKMKKSKTKPKTRKTNP